MLSMWVSCWGRSGLDGDRGGVHGPSPSAPPEPHSAASPEFTATPRGSEPIYSHAWSGFIP